MISDAQVHRMLVARIDGQRQGTGIVVGIIDPKGKRVLAYGTMGVEDTRPVDGDTVFDLGSITKVFTALLLSEMVQRGEVALNDPAQKYLPADVHLHIHGGRQITLADLATHTAGFPSRPTNLDPLGPKQAHGYPADLLYQFLSSGERVCRNLRRRCGRPHLVAPYQLRVRARIHAFAGRIVCTLENAIPAVLAK